MICSWVRMPKLRIDGDRTTPNLHHRGSEAHNKFQGAVGPEGSTFFQEKENGLAVSPFGDGTFATVIRKGGEPKLSALPCQVALG